MCISLSIGYFCCLYPMPTNNYNKLTNMIGKHFDTSASPAGRWLHYKILATEPGLVEASIFIRDEMTNPSNQLHGGMFALIADELCGLAYYSLGLDTFYTTLNLHLNYLYSANAGSTLFIKAQVIRSGKKIGHVSCEMYDEENKLLATASTNLVNTNKEIFQLTPTD